VAGLKSYDAEIEFRHGAQAGDVVVLTAGGRRWILDGDGEVSASVLIAAPARDDGSL
jgi:hypothetical protein